MNKMSLQEIKKTAEYMETHYFSPESTMDDSKKLPTFDNKTIYPLNKLFKDYI